MGLIQEQHPERCALFMQWKQMEFPVLIDSLNRIGVSAVPLLWAIDEHGVIRKTRPKFEWVASEFIGKSFPAPDALPTPTIPRGGVASYLAGRWDEALDTWGKQVVAAPGSAATWFRLGCAYRARYDSPGRRPGDFQEAVRAWTRALGLVPSNYIWRRRLQQYGPTLDKPYPFYSWVEEARQEIRARGGTPIVLAAEPEGAELAAPIRRFVAADETSADAERYAEVPRDTDGLVGVEVVVAPEPVAPGKPARVGITFRPDPSRQVHWTNDAGPLRLVIVAPEGWRVSAHERTAPVPAGRDVSTEVRQLDFEVVVPGGAAEDAGAVSCFALYYVCHGEDGTCVYLRQDLPVRVRIERQP